MLPYIMMRIQLLSGQSNKQLQDMLRYFTDPQPVNIMKLDKEGLINAVKATVDVLREKMATVTPIASV